MRVVFKTTCLKEQRSGYSEESLGLEKPNTVPYTIAPCMEGRGEGDSQVEYRDQESNSN